MANHEEPHYQLEVIAQMLEIHPDTIRRYERRGLIRSVQLRSQRMYSERALLRLRRIVSMTGLGVNLPGAEVICNLLERLEDKDHQLEALRHQLQRLLEE